MLFYGGFCDPISSAAHDVMPSVIVVFNSALTSPGTIKNASMDALGNFKIPMLGSYLRKGFRPDGDGWVDITPSSNCSY